jgi:glycosyltransferase involved in cell wall biosynthesis
LSDATISVLTPTRGREPFLPLLVDCFRSQTAAPLELLVLDDSPEPSRFLAAEAERDPRIVYRHASVPSTTGEKRQALMEAARGDVLAYFDDDDWYAPGYLAFMLAALGGDDLVKLSAWYNYSLHDGHVYYWDTRAVLPVHYRLPPRPPGLLVDGRSLARENQDGFVWGYGFSYVFRREMVKLGVEAIGHGEDYAFLRRGVAAGHKTRLVADELGLAFHLLHAHNTSKVFPQYVLPPFLALRTFGDALERYRSAGLGGGSGP